MVGKERELILFTRSFPYGHGEEFIYEEILQLSHYFKFIYIIHLEVNEYKRKLPHNVIVKKIDVQIYKTLKEAFDSLECLQTITPQPALVEAYKTIYNNWKKAIEHVHHGLLLL